MKKNLFLLCITFFVFSLPFSVQSAYYVAPTGGDDDNLGTIDEPWATWQKAFDTAEAGDTVYFRGGVWYPTVTTHYLPMGGHGNNGTSDNWIVYMNYPGEVPILDCINFPVSTTSRSGLNVEGVTYVKFKELTIRNNRQTTEAQWIAGVCFTDCGVLYLEQITSTGHGGAGFRVAGWDTLYMVNCDSYNNIDSTSTGIIGGRADGYTMASGGTALDTFKIAYIYGCRAWYNSDDGFDISSTKQLDVHDCWSWNNGRLYGDACGFKWAYSTVLTPLKRKIYNTITADNYNYSELGDMIGGGHVFTNLNDTVYGIYQAIYNNSSYRDYMGHMSAYGAFDCEDEALAIYRNNLVYEPQDPSGPYQAGFKACNYDYPTYVIQDHNTWVQTGNYWQTEPNDSFTVTDADFVSLDTSQLSQSRKADGSLPDITFLHLRQGSDLTDRGIDVDLPYVGSAPDLGAFEYGASSGILVLNPIHPNPFRETTTITYTITIQGNIKIAIFDLLGRELKILLDENLSEGTYEETWDGTDKEGDKVRSGIYFCHISSESGNAVAMKTIFLK